MDFLQKTGRFPSWSEWDSQDPAKLQSAVPPPRIHLFAIGERFPHQTYCCIHRGEAAPPDLSIVLQHMDMGQPLQRLTKRRTIRLFVDMDKGLIFCPPWLLSPPGVEYASGPYGRVSGTQFSFLHAFLHRFSPRCPFALANPHRYVNAFHRQCAAMIHSRFGTSVENAPLHSAPPKRTAQAE